ncbi:hypothetical protein MAR_011123 [Mya arenaria]|uniref:Uncharacterized protein n=1 Tax=Mya arenaria TaxID=6604 RepID=A0ABY7FW88_MYAAR|nr:hypothetical protein MAR_011123 [Mya arenaria]
MEKKHELYCVYLSIWSPNSSSPSSSSTTWLSSSNSSESSSNGGRSRPGLEVIGSRPLRDRAGLVTDENGSDDEIDTWEWVVLMSLTTKSGHVLSYAPVTMATDIAQLSDEDLRQQLQECEEEEEEEEDEEVQINYRPPVQPKPVRPQITSTPVAAEAPRTYKPIVQARTATPTMPATRRNVGRTEAAYTPATSPPTNAASKSGGGGGVGMWLKLIFLLVVAFLVYLVVINMNPNAESKIPLSLEDDS